MTQGTVRRGRKARRGMALGDALARWRGEAWRALTAAPFYRRTLIGPAPGELRLKLTERWPGDPTRGNAILAGNIEFAGELIRRPTPAWFPPGASAEWLAEWHGFGWLADVIAAGTASRDPARVLVRSWIDDGAAWHKVSWRPDVAATRILAWIVHFEELAGRDTDRALRRAMLSSIAAQVRHLGRVAGWEVAGAARLRALKGLIGGSIALGGPAQRTKRALRGLERELAAQILPDGGHLTRSPSVQLQVLRDLIDIRAMLRAAGLDVPAALPQAIDRMAPMLRFFRHGDRRLALFNGSVEEDPVLVDLVLTRSESRGQAPPQAPDCGFQRISAGQTLVVLDSGRPPPAGFDGAAHAGVLSFELSHGRDRIVVNCGGYRGAKPVWRRLARTSAAHSVLVADDTNAVEILADGSLGRAPRAVACERAEEGGHQWIAAAHDGYRRRHGVGYARELYLAADGDDMRGEDRLTGRSGVAFAVRFHLHPSVEASLAADGGGAVLRLPGGTAWRLRAAGAEMNLADSVYLGSGEVRPTTQIVLSGATGRDGATVRWAIRREPAKPAAMAASEAAAPARDGFEPEPAVMEAENAAPAEPAAEARAESAEPAATGGAADNKANAPEPDGKPKPAEGTDDGA
ncbi:MAG: heparinase II/III family protein [Alphaproteobacteria bacterium]